VHFVDSIYARYGRSDQPYFELLDRIHQHLVPRTYFEIGVSTGRSLTLVLPGTIAIGVDPAPNPIFPIRRGTRIFHQTSDEFFSQHDLQALFGGLPLDLAFIDGMHHFEFALRDFMNLERSSNPETTVLVHDCLPIDEVTAERERCTQVWSGDVWRLIVLLREWRPDLDIAVIDSGPTGLGLIRSLDRNSTVLQSHYDEIVEQYLAMPYTSLANASKNSTLNVISGDWPVVLSRLPRRPFRASNLEFLKAGRAFETVMPVARRKVRAARSRLVSKSHLRGSVSVRTDSDGCSGR